MMNERIEKAINEQMNRELYSSYLYLSMAAYAEATNFKGAANWMKVQAREELLHMMKFFNFVCDRDGRVQLKALDGPPVEWKSLQQLFEEALKHEKYVTSCINDLVGLAVETKDTAAQVFLQWFVNEQVEEEAAAKNIVEQLKMVAGAPAALFLIDKELAMRQPAPEPPAGA